MAHIIINRINDFHVNGPFPHSKFNSKIICFHMVFNQSYFRHDRKNGVIFYQSNGKHKTSEYNFPII